ncbi:YgfZ/GcvT domain-containing protein [Roseibium aggregatum]|uniref:Folate-binding protein YgfZ n=1 Tax=Roseibium aggregatum TaxID=187304 RepID=A0A926P5C9_9HYPH|nr:folate-binding protein YgfZ [Roseibium aggregatum]MBD1547622.1 folate-binding protein YgfZ [Roseibium aggregatum]
MTKPQFAILPNRGVIRVSGPDAHHFLQNLITADMEEIDNRGAGYGALLTPQGKILFDFLILKDGDSYLLDTPAETLADLAKRLTFYRLRSKVEVVDASSDLGVFACWNGAPPKDLPGVRAEDPRLAALGWRVIGEPEAVKPALEAGGFAEADYAAHRIALGVPEGLADFAYSDVFPHDADMDQLGGVSFSKGCYVGQEVVSRVHHRGTARKRIIRVSSEADLPAPGTEITADGKVMGTLGSVARGTGGTQGLALVRLDKAAAALKNGTPFHCGSNEVTLALPDWAGFGWPEDAAGDD